MKIITKEEAIKRIEFKFPNEPFELLEYSRVTKPIVIKCGRCGTVTRFSSLSNYLGASRKGVCYCYNENNAKTKHDKNKEKVLQLIKEKDQSFIRFGYNEHKKYTVTAKCRKCEQEFSKPWTDYIKNPTCPFCENKQKMNTQSFKTLLPKEYTLLSEYKHTDEYVLVKHECGFVWKRRAKGLLTYSGCPKCNKNKSSGEKRILEILDMKQIPYKYQASFPWQTNWKRKYDFYLPEQNLLIEYQGRQHYEETNFFDITLEQQQEIDEEKKNDAIKNGFNFIAIPYTDFNKLEEIITDLTNSTTSHFGVDSSESKEQPSTLEEKIV